MNARTQTMVVTIATIIALATVFLALVFTLNSGG